VNLQNAPCNDKNIKTFTTAVPADAEMKQEEKQTCLYARKE
jgi:hypothetical protein